jgi:drug/metabolite transporter (DMT)-like permease
MTGLLSAPVRGALWMLLASFCYVSSATLTRELAGAYSVFELTFFRCVIAVFVLAPLVLQGGIGKLKTKIFPLHCARTVITYTAIVLWFYGTEHVPVADFFAIQFITPIFTIGCAVLLLRERVGVKSWIAAAIGFAGVLIIIRPGLMEVTWGIGAAVTTAASYALINTLIKIMSRHDSPVVMSFYANFLVVPISVIPAILTWKTPAMDDAPMLLGVALFSTMAQLCVAFAISLADARVVQPMNFMRMPIAAILGYFAFSEFPDIWTWTGAIVIFGAGWYAVQQGREKKTP